MVISKVEYGLGNQLFQYAFAKRISLECKEPLFLDLSWYTNFDVKDGFTHREFLLDRFAIDFKTLESKDTEVMSNSFFKKLLLKLRSINLGLYVKLTGKFEAWAFKQNTLDPIGLAKSIKGDKRLLGEWLNHKYLEPILEEIQNEFTVKDSPNTRNSQFLEQINTSSSIFLHIRRGDYLAKRMHDLGGICDEVYFDKAISQMDSKIAEPRYFVFSDDLEWCISKFGDKENFTFIEGNENDPIEDLRLMMSCKHAIISNSTFSWWGAWLIKNKDKNIIAPSLWNRKNPELINDLIPKNWNRILIENKI